MFAVSPLLFDIFFAAVIDILIITNRSGEEQCVLAILAHLEKDPSTVGPGKAATAKLIMPASPHGRQRDAKIATVVVGVCEAFA